MSKSMLAKPTPRNDIYTGILAIAGLAMLMCCAFLYLDWHSYPEGKPKSVSIASRR